MRIRSVHSRRTVPTQRSAYVFALGLSRWAEHVDRGGGEVRVERGGELRVPVVE